MGDQRAAHCDTTGITASRSANHPSVDFHAVQLENNGDGNDTRGDYGDNQSEEELTAHPALTRGVLLTPPLTPSLVHEPHRSILPFATPP